MFVARQPIFTDREEVFAYELLYRNNQNNQFPEINGEEATAEVIINSFLNIGIDELSNGKPCFINFTEKLLFLKLPTYFRPREIIVEILETVEPTIEMIEICKELKSLGYKIALDDYVFNGHNELSFQLLSLVDIIKVDFLNTTVEMRKNIESVAKMLKLKLLAEKVETYQVFEEAKLKGYDYYQGYFFAKPVIISTHDIPTYFHSYFKVIQSLTASEPSIETITQLIENDLSLSYKLLKLINSPAFRPRQKINSIRQAIVLLGLIEIQKWIYVLAVRDAAGTKKAISKEIVGLCLTRAKLSERIATEIKKSSTTSEFFITGMFSLMDTLLKIPMDKILKDLPLDDQICGALKGQNNLLKIVLDLSIAVEKANWLEVSTLCQSLHLNESDVFQMYTEAMSWSKDVLSSDAQQKPV
ncbi:EAL and HDOD domain-containing protein [Bacillus sp. CGMCC 1.16607]|uniref:EAL and HDOD domain-containing protein n=1 Tax=Bacillus sp. CGMCC 1.16607 TaxID=3351842 RepID=UPI003641432E